MENQLEKTFHELKTLGNYNVYKVLNDVIPSLSSLLPLDNEWEVQWVYIPVFQGGLVDSLLYHDSITVFFLIETSSKILATFSSKITPPPIWR